MSDVKIRKGNLEGKGTYANRNFKKGEVVIKYNLKPLTKEEYEKLSENLKNYVLYWENIIEGIRRHKRR